MTARCAGGAFPHTPRGISRPAGAACTDCIGHGTAAILRLSAAVAAPATTPGHTLSNAPYTP
ncbi:hypothetical protein GCM10022229_15830 [Luteimonas lutimaris]|uniref:Uncharacterized protein n=1 Tax=Luteimonas lutimaris TaxID=698645 RepID=A0ABP7MH62_9GAMM